LTGTLRGPSARRADVGSLSAAARKIGLTQPTFSRQVAALEDALGVTLFESRSR
jgi:DNA-binding transcriptional LysR family regulator